MEIEIDLEKIRKNKVFIATPCYGGMVTGLFLKSCLDLQTLFLNHRLNTKFSFIFNESLITRARNYLVDEFLRNEDCSHLLFIDADIHFQAQDVLTLLALDRDIIGAPYPKKTINWKNVVHAVKKNENLNPKELENVVGDYVFNVVKGTERIDISEPVEVMEIGTGYMLIKREVFTKFKNAYPELSYKPDHVGQANFDGSREIHAYFDTVIDPISKRYLSEDYMFCQWWRKIGGQIWLCPWMQTQHTGTYSFTGNLPRIAELSGKL